MRKKKLYMSTTNAVENGKVVENLGIVSSHLVAGTGFLSDFTAGLSDFFGGRSGTYKRQLESLYYDAMVELSDNARELGANALIGVRIDMDNISGKGMSMFMITALGTAVIAEFNSERKTETKAPVEGISLDMLSGEIERKRVLAELAGENVTITKESCDYILNNPSPEYAPGLVKRYEKIGSTEFTSDEYYGDFRKEFANYISVIDRDTAIKYLYPLLKDANTVLFSRTLQLLDENQLFDAGSIADYLRDGSLEGNVYCLLKLPKPSYTSNDLDKMKAILTTIESLPDLGRSEGAKDGLFKGKEKFICRNGHKNNTDREFCSTCGENIKGQTEEDVKAISVFRNRCNALEELLENE